MPLSEREQRILEDIERSLTAQDPSFLKDSERPPSPHAFRNVKRGALLFAAGLALLITFFVMRVVLVGVAAFAAMVAGLVLAVGGLGAVRLPSAPQAWDRSRRHVNGRFDQWEQRLRDRYRRR